MNAKRSKKWIWITIGIVLFIGAVVFISLKAIGLITENKRANASPPTVQIVSPIAGDIFPVGQTIYTAATAVGTADIQYIELHLDGESAGKAFNDDGSGGAFDGQFEFMITDGGHMLSARTVDKNGLVGQSIPIPVYGTVETENAAALVFTSEEGDTLASIADDLGVELDDLEQLNPNLGDGDLPPGTSTNLPDDDIKEPPPEPAAAGGGQPGQPGTTTKKDVTPPNTPMLTEKIRANPIINPFKVLTQIKPFVVFADDKPPQAPDGLEVSHEGCLVTMKWNDNSESEDSYRIWFTGLGMPPRVIATVSSSDHTGPVWYQFTTPPAGIYGFWVEAVNIIGAQPSEEFWLGIPATQCEDYTAAYLSFTIPAFDLKGNYDRVYCYVSVEGAPEQRYPRSRNKYLNDFITPGISIVWFQVDVNERSFTIPYPEDGAVDIAGECLAWSGDLLNSLGEFSTILIPDEILLTEPHLIDTPNFSMWITIVPAGSENPEGTYTFSNPLIKSPYNLQITDTGRYSNPYYPSEKYLTWEWEGDESEIEGFTVFLNDNPFKLALPHGRSVCYFPSDTCGRHMKLEVAANLPHGQSPRSEAKEYDMERCPLWAEVHFVSIETGSTDDGSGECNIIETYFELIAWGATEASQKMGHESVSGFLVKGNISLQYPMICNKLYTFNDIGYATTNKRDLDRLIVQIDPNKAFLEIGVFGWDYDWGSGNDILHMSRKIIPFLPVDNWDGYEEEIRLHSSLDAGTTDVIVRIRAIPEPSPFD